MLPDRGCSRLEALSILQHAGVRLTLWQSTGLLLGLAPGVAVQSLLLVECCSAPSDTISVIYSAS